MEKLVQPDPPTGISRFLFRLPIYLYRWHLGGLLGGRFLLLHHIGRKTGKPRQVVVEVVRYDAATDTYVVASGFGEKADWYQNVLNTPQVTIQVGWHPHKVTAVPLSPEEGGNVMAHYAAAHPTAAKNLARFMGYGVDGSEADYRALGHAIPFIKFVPRSSTQT